MISNADIGTVIQYYDEGWRAGYLEELKGNDVKIRPITPYKSQEKPHLKRYKLTDIRLIE